MPTKNTIKTYIENGYYHLYNRGVDKREIFIEKQDCIVFQHYLKLYLSSPDILQKNPSLSFHTLYKIHNLNLNKELDLLSFALMPNHFHIQVKQYTKTAIEKLMRRVLTSYSQYFNKKYKRVGTLFESTYKAVMITTDSQNLYLSSYIHRNPMRLKNPKFDYIQYSSYPYYLKNKQTDWIKTDEILSFFRSSKNLLDSDVLSYEGFVQNFNENSLNIVNGIIVEKLEDY